MSAMLWTLIIVLAIVLCPLALAATWVQSHLFGPEPPKEVH